MGRVNKSWISKGLECRAEDFDFILKGVGSHGMGEQRLRRGWDTGGGLPIV